ncbi:MAG: tRNA dimethylallyltransferase 2 [Candidatus Campbellbacteria bacterium]
MQKPKLIIILGPTATGKSSLAVRLAKAIGGEIVSADSRQVYRGMDLGTGKITQREMHGVPHHLLDVVSPRQQYSVAHFVRDAKKSATSIRKKGFVPIVVGGTGLYIDALARGTSLPEVPPNLRLRAKLEKMPTEKLFMLLKKKDPRRAKNIDPHNRRRLIRALEITARLGVVPRQKPKSDFEALFIGLTLPKEKLNKKIYARLLSRMRQGMVAEVRKLRAGGLSWKKLEDFGLEYRNIAQYLQKKITKEEVLARLAKDIEHYAKRQMTWFKRHPDIHWFSPSEFSKIKTLSKKFLTS